MQNRPHFERHTKKLLKTLKCKIFNCPTNSFDLTPSDCYIFDLKTGFKTWRRPDVQ